MSEQLTLSLNRPPPYRSPLHDGFFGDRVFTSCWTQFTRIDLWAYEFKLRLLLPERPAPTAEEYQEKKWEGSAIHHPNGSVTWRPNWESRVPIVLTESETWKAGTRGNDPKIIEIEIICTEFFPEERDHLLRWMKDGCPLEGDAHEQDLRRDIEMWFVQEIQAHNVGPEIEAALLRVPMDEPLRENLLLNLHNYRKEDADGTRPR